MSPHLHQASMSASYIILPHNESENPTSQLNESTGKPRQNGVASTDQEERVLHFGPTKSKNTENPVETEILVDQLKLLPIQIQI